MLVFNVTNRYVNLNPVLADLAKAKGLACLTYGDYSAGIAGKFSSDWTVLARKPHDLARMPGEYPLMLSVAPSAGGALAVPWAALGQSLQGEWPHLRSRLDPTIWEPPDGLGARIWTDDYSNLLSVTNW